MPLEVGEEENLAVIGGRAFVSGADYRATVERFRVGDLQVARQRALPKCDLLRTGKARRASWTIGACCRQVHRSRIEPEAPATVAVAGQKPRDATSARPGPADINANTLEMQREIAQLRVELDQRSQLDESLQHFLERINAGSTTNLCGDSEELEELLLAERASLFAFEESSNELIAKGVGFPVEIADISHIRVGEGIAGRVMESGRHWS